MPPSPISPDWKDLERGVESDSPSVTESWAAALAAAIPPDTVLALHGELGAGKTTFVRGLARAWGIREAVTSPTFNLLAVYRGSRTLLHLDAYRLDGPDQSDALLLEDFLQSPWCLAVEWPERFDPMWTREAWRLEFRPGPRECMRSIRLFLPQ